MLAWISLGVAALALLVNVSALWRRPAVTAEWVDTEYGDPVLVVVIVARRRPVHVTDVGMVHLPRKLARSRRGPEYVDPHRPLRYPMQLMTGVSLPVRLQDGETVRAWIGMDGDSVDVPPEALEEGSGFPHAYISASGVTYIVRPTPFGKWWTRRGRRLTGEYDTPAGRFWRWAGMPLLLEKSMRARRRPRP